jgi:hypothetical protein
MDKLTENSYVCNKRCEKYCSKTCRKLAHEEYHEYLCGVDMVGFRTFLAPKRDYIRGTTMLILKLIGYCVANGLSSPFEDEWIGNLSGSISLKVDLNEFEEPYKFICESLKHAQRPVFNHFVNE